MALARSLAEGHGFSNPFYFPTGPTATLAPLHPLLMAAILAIFGDRPLAAVPLILAEVLMHVGCAAILLRISVQVFSSWIPGLIALIGLLLSTRPFPQWENGMAQLGAELFFLTALSGNATRSGVVAGLGWLVSPALMLITVPSAFVLRGMRFTGKMSLIAILIVMPWSMRNSLTFAAPIFIRDNFGLELFMSNNDLAGLRQRDAPERYKLMHPNENEKVAAELRAQGEPAYFAHLQQRAIVWIQEHPQRFLELTAGRIRLWWAANFLAALFSILGCLGLWRLRRLPVAQAAALSLLLFPLPYYVIQFDSRYAFPVLWLLLLFAGAQLTKYLPDSLTMATVAPTMARQSDLSNPTAPSI